MPFLVKRLIEANMLMLLRDAFHIVVFCSDIECF